MLADFLPSVLSSSYPNFSVHVIDNASKDDTVSYVKAEFPEVNLIPHGQNYGFSGGYNRGLHQVEADYYVLLNQDVAVTEDWLQPVIERMEGLIRHTYGEMELESKKIQQELLKRVRAAGDRFEQEIGSAAMDLADAAEDQVRTTWSRLRRQYAITVTEDGECRKLLQMGYKPSGREEARQIVRRLKNAYEQHVEDNTFGVHVAVTYADGGRDRFRDLRAVFESGRQAIEKRREKQRWEDAREDFDFEAWKEAGCPSDWDGG
jgi:glycosyltransferase involved in cell wall biosynthesis